MAAISRNTVCRRIAGKDVMAFGTDQLGEIRNDISGGIATLGEGGEQRNCHAITGRGIS